MRWCSELLPAFFDWGRHAIAVALELSRMVGIQNVPAVHCRLFGQSNA